MYALSVMFAIDPAHADDFKEAALRHAANTKTNETGCLGFDVFVSETDPTRFYFHEIYANKAAVEEIHNKATYPAEFGQKTRDWITSREKFSWNSAE